MKTFFKFLAVLTVLVFSFAPILVRAQDAPPPPPDQGAPPPPPDAQDQSAQGGDDQGTSFQTFYDQLGDQGTWVQTDDYGYVFQPNVTDPNWAPYTDGHWVYSDAGWVWVSDEPWGWATYHYGRWANIDGFGWIWVPGYRWAPAWVSWRYGGGYCGWAPLPPRTFIGVDYSSGGGFHFGGDVDVAFGIGAGAYSFIRVGDMGNPNYRGRFLDRSRNFTVINNTTNVTNINVARNGGATSNFRSVAVGGPPINEVNAHASQHIQTVQLTASNQPGRSTLHGNSLAIFAPSVSSANAHTARPAQVSQTIAHPTFNRGDSITKPLAVTANVKPPAPTPQAIQAAQTAQLHAPAKAKIATEKTAGSAPLSKPLTSLSPVAPVHQTRNATTSGSTSLNGANTANPNMQHSTANSQFTGESVKPAATSHPQTEEKSASTFHPSTEEKPASTFHPQTEEKPASTFHPSTEEKPASAFHPQSQGSGGAAAPVHAKTAPVSHPAATQGKPAGGNEAKKAADDKTPPGH